MSSSGVGGLRVLVIGAGPAGLCSARHIIASNPDSTSPGPPHFAAPLLLERSACIGGIWVYGDTPLYRSLRTNLPVEIMSFLDFPFPQDGPVEESYVHHTHVRKYLSEYAERHGLMKYIKFRQEVREVKPLIVDGDPGGTKWHAVWCDLDTKECREGLFDAVMVCKGNYSKPYVPLIPGIDRFQGEVLHSQEYREPGAFTDKEVVILGSSFSAIDISQDIAPVARKVTICDRSGRKILKEFPENVSLSPNVSEADEDGFTFEDGARCPADTLIYCTGYLYDFPFLSAECKIDVVNGGLVRPLYKHLVNIEHPTMCIVGVPRLVIPFVLFDYQVQYYLKTLTGAIALPNREEMLRHCSDSTPGKGHVLLHDAEWDYYEDLALSAGLPTLPAVTRRIKNDSMCFLRCEISPFKVYKYEVLDGETFKKTPVATDGMV